MTGSCFGDLGGMRSCWGYRLKLVHKKQQQNIDTFLKNVTFFPLKSLQKATNNFSTYMGMGGFSSSYKGILEDGTVVAVKVFRYGEGYWDTKGKDSDFYSLITMMSRIRHRNLVEFIGCCFEGDRGIIVYEFVGDHSLDQLLFNVDSKSAELSWPVRASICRGIAHGIEYLHQGINPRVIHRDIKPSNVLLDKNFNPKLVDFEIAVFFRDEVSHHSGAIAGTYGYMDPEYLATGRCTEKADVYSFGILLLEVISGRKNVQFSRDEGTTLVDYVWRLRENDRVLDIVDPTLSEFADDEVKRFIDVALFCVQQSSSLRPSMSEVLLMLSGGYDFSKKILPKPGPFFWTTKYDALSSPDHDPPLLSRDKAVASTFRSDSFSSLQQCEIHEEIVRAASFERVLSGPLAQTKGKMMPEHEIETESDLETDSSAVELKHMSQDLETELYGSIEPNTSDAVSAYLPSDKPALKPETMSTSSGKTGTPAHIEAVETDSFQKPVERKSAEQMQIAHDIEAVSIEPKTSFGVSMSWLSDETALEPEIITTTSAQTNILVQNDAVEGLSFQVDDRQQNAKVNIMRPVQCIIEKILEALNDDQSRRICLHGRCGSGKTTVLKTLCHHPATRYLFDQVICVSVPRFAWQRKVQNEIASQLSLNIKDSTSEDEISNIIRRALAGRKFLVLFDDVVEIINLHEVGIPSPGPENTCWLVLATGSLDVCHAMADRTIEVEALSTEEAWELFCCEVGDVISSSEIKPYARAVAEECHGLPLIISAIGSALRGENSVEQWKLALRILEFSDTSNADNQYSLNPHVKYCYDRQKDRDAKTCFLYCALFPKDKGIDVSLLVECFIDEGFLGGRSNAAYNKGHDIIGHLVNASLLEAIDNGLMVKMHDVIRDSALVILTSVTEGHLLLGRSYLRSIVVPKSEKDEVTAFGDITSPTKFTSPNIHKYLNSAGAKLKEPPSLEEWEEATMIFLMDNELSSLPMKPNCPTLVALFLQRNSSLRVIPTSFFDSMCTLRILNLSKSRIRSLPESFSKLENLQVLTLRDCERLLMLPPSIGSLKHLEVLDLQGTELSHLPDTISGLASLKQLKVSFYGSINRSEYNKLPRKLIRNGIISTLDLRELGVFVYPGDHRWTSSASEITKEVSSMKLSALFFNFPEVECLKYFLDGSQSWTNRDLTTFNFIVGRDFKRIVSRVSRDAELMYSGDERCLRFVNGENIPDAVAKVLSRATSFYLDHHLSVCYLSEFGVDSMNALKICIVRDCPELLAIVKGSEQTKAVLPSLEYWSLNYLWNMKSIWVGRVEMGSLARLRHLYVHACPKLRYVFTRSMLDILHNLEELVVEDCESLKYIVVEDEVAMDNGPTDENANVNQVTTTVDGEFPVLNSLKVLKLNYLPELCGVWKGRWPCLEYISFYNCPKLKNLHMIANDDVKIKEIAADRVWWELLDWDDHELARRLLKCVTQICIDDL